MGELMKTGILLHIMKLVGEPGKLMVSIPELEWELVGTQLAALLGAAFDRIQHLADTAIEETDPDEDSVEYTNPATLLLEHRDHCFQQLRLFSMAETLKDNLGSELAGIGFALDEFLEKPCCTVIYWS